MKNVKIIKVTYALKLSKDIIEQIGDANLRNEKGIAYKLINQSEGQILNVNYALGEADLHITVKINGPEINISPNKELWDFIADVINKHLNL